MTVKTVRKCFAFTLGMALLALAPWSSAFASWNAGNFLKFGIGARAMGMGNSFVAIADDATAIYWNPAGLTLATRNEVFVSYAERFGAGIQDHNGGIALRWRKRINVGFAFARTSLGDIKHTTEGVVDSRGRPVIDGTFDDAEVALLFASGVRVLEIFSVGVTAKYMIHELAGQSANGIALDVGWLFCPVEALKLGMNAQNINRPRMKWTTHETHYDRIPANFKFGGAVSMLDSKLKVSADLNIPDFGDLVFNSGVEYALTNYLAMRGGLAQAELATGASISWDRVRLDYAYRTRELGDTHRFALVYGF